MYPFKPIKNNAGSGNHGMYFNLLLMIKPASMNTQRTK